MTNKNRFGGPGSTADPDVHMQGRQSPCNNYRSKLLQPFWRPEWWLTELSVLSIVSALRSKDSFFVSHVLVDVLKHNHDSRATCSELCSWSQVHQLHVVWETHHSEETKWPWAISPIATNSWLDFLAALLSQCLNGHDQIQTGSTSSVCEGLSTSERLIEQNSLLPNNSIWQLFKIHDWFSQLWIGKKQEKRLLTDIGTASWTDQTTASMATNNIFLFVLCNYQGCRGTNCHDSQEGTEVCNSSHLQCRHTECHQGCSQTANLMLHLAWKDLQTWWIQSISSSLRFDKGYQLSMVYTKKYSSSLTWQSAHMIQRSAAWLLESQTWGFCSHPRQIEVQMVLGQGYQQPLEDWRCQNSLKTLAEFRMCLERGIETSQTCLRNLEQRLSKGELAWWKAGDAFEKWGMIGIEGLLSRG